MKQRYFSQRLELAKVGDYYIRLTIAGQDHILPVEDFFMAVMACCAGNSTETLEVLSSTTTESAQVAAKNAHVQVVEEVQNHIKTGEKS